MYFAPKEITLKDGRKAILRSVEPGDAEEMVAYLVATAGETEFVMNYPEEREGLTTEKEAELLDRLAQSPDVLMLTCRVDGELAGNCALHLKNKEKTRHRGSVAIALCRKFWGLGLGTAMLSELIDAGRRLGLAQIELDYVEGNVRGRRLYEKLGFVETGRIPDGFRWRDGSSHADVFMVRKL